MDHCLPVVRAGVVPGFNFNCALMLTNRLLQVEVFGIKNFAERVVRFGEIRVQLHSFERCRSGFGTNLFRIGAGIIRKQSVRFAKSSVDRRVFRVARDGLIVELNRA